VGPRSLYTGSMISDHFTKRTSAPQPQMLIVVVMWAVAVICLTEGTQPKWAWAMVGMATLLSVYVGVRFWLYFGRSKAR